MTYDGEVTVGGPAQTLTTEQLTISKVAVGPLDNNSYLLRCRQTGAALLIDAANEADRLLELCGGKLDLVLTTHCHPDHFQALAAVVSETGARTLSHCREAPHIPVATDTELTDGDVIALGDVRLRAVTLTGHRRWGSEHVSSSIAVIHRDFDNSSHIFTGDALFPGGIGNTCDDPVATATLLQDVTEKVFNVLPDDTRIYPGHGHDTTVGRERPQLPAWRAAITH